MREYARSKIIGEDMLSRCGETMHIDLYRIAVASGPEYLNECLGWSAQRACFALYRNSHFISSMNVARAMIYLMELALKKGNPGVEIYNIADTASPTFAEVYRKAGRKPGLSVPVVFDVLKNIKIGRTLARRYPMGWFRLDNTKLKATGFDLELQG
jgi:nucleoside-diphosphate-sugar epimerase